MPEIFNPKDQSDSVELKIVAALERVYEAFRSLLWQEGKARGLSPIQLQILVFLLYHKESQRRITYLASEFALTKATVSDSIGSLVQKGLIQKVRSTNDARALVLNLTEQGRTLAQQAAHFADQLQVPLAALSGSQRNDMLDALMRLIRNLHREGIITVQRMCFTCRFYKDGHREARHYCTLLQEALDAGQLRVDCPEHQAADA